MMPWLVQIMDRGQIQAYEFFDFLSHKTAEGSQYIGIIFNRLLVQFCLIHFIIKEEFRCIMLARRHHY